MVERQQILEIDIIDTKNKLVKEKAEIEVSPGILNKYGKFISKVRLEMSSGLRYYSEDARKGKHGKRRGDRELKDIRKDYPSKEEMREIVDLLDGKIEGKKLTIISEGDQIFGFRIDNTNNIGK